MIDPKNITNYNLDKNQLEEHMLFWICAAGKNGVTSARGLNSLLTCLRGHMVQAKIFFWSNEIVALSPFDLVKHTQEKDLARLMKASGLGCYNIKAATFKRLAESGINLETCSVDELENIKGIGPKTARCFLIHSRPNQKLAGLDRHILHFLHDKGYNVPKSTPTGKRYKQVEAWFLKEVSKSGKTVSELDLEIWNKYREKK